jgi:poly-gamma-glutamate capsule biosynthesis protein CapA/YwtB (metallophosphatase superfamily)
MGTSPRRDHLRRAAAAAFFFVLLAFAGASLQAADSSKTLSIIVGSDVEWALSLPDRTYRTVYDDGGKSLLDGGWQPVPHQLSPEKLARLKAANDPIYQRYVARTERVEGAPFDQIQNFLSAQTLNVTTPFASEAERNFFPLKKIAPVLRDADITYVNLETVLSDTAYCVGYFKTPTSFATALKDAGVDVVSLANNHMLDCERPGLFDTIKTLDATGIKNVGAGVDLAAARKPVIFDKNGIKVAFLSYTQMENSGVNSFANPRRAGVMPMDPDLILEDIAAIRGSVDYIILLFHWDIFRFDVAHQQDVHPEAVKFARAMVDAGADGIIGNDPHVVRAAEMYKGKPIFYSLGQTIFSYSIPAWGDNILGRITLSKQRVEKVEVLPLAGRGTDLGQPYLLTGARAKAVIDNLQDISAHLGTKIKHRGDVGVLGN